MSICRPLNGEKRAADSHDAALLGLRGEDAPLSATRSVHQEPDSSTVTMTTVLIVTHGVTQSRPDAAQWASGWDSPHAGRHTLWSVSNLNVHFHRLFMLVAMPPAHVTLSPSKAAEHRTGRRACLVDSVPGCVRDFCPTWLPPLRGVWPLRGVPSSQPQRTTSASASGRRCLRTDPLPRRPCSLSRSGGDATRINSFVPQGGRVRSVNRKKNVKRVSLGAARAFWLAERKCVLLMAKVM